MMLSLVYSILLLPEPLIARHRVNLQIAAADDVITRGTAPLKMIEHLVAVSVVALRGAIRVAIQVRLLAVQIVLCLSAVTLDCC